LIRLQECLKFVPTFVDKKLLGEIMFKKSFVLFVIPFFLSQQSFANPESVSGSGGDAAEGTPTKLMSEVTISNALVGVMGCKAFIPTIAEIETAHKTYTSTKDSCVSMQAKAASACLESLSPEMAETTANINMLVSMIGGAAVSDACSNMAKAMNIAKAGMSAYTAACGAMRAGCSSSCVKSKAALESMKKLLELPPVAAIGAGAPANCAEMYSTFTKSALAAVTEEMNSKDIKSVAGKGAVCTGKYAALLSSGALGLISIVKSLGESKNCNAATDGSVTATDLSNLDIKCAMAEYKNTTECICHLNPRQTGCVNSLEKTNGGSGYSGMSAGSGSGGSGSAGGNVTLPTGSESTMPEIASKSAGAGGAGAPVGGGSGIGGGGSAGGNSGGAGGEDGHKGLNTNILSGSGGGGGGWGGGSRSAADAKYRPYLPGGAKDPQRGVAGQGVSNEVTGQGGKSNWEKVRDRYRDNNSTLLNN
jgi:hypothetical protein